MEKMHQENLGYIKNILLPDMVFDRCFCEPKSREFVEFQSADLEALEPPTGESKTDSLAIYKGTANVEFSGETTTFPIFVKLFVKALDSFPYDVFPNEQLFYSKIAPKFKDECDFIPKCYFADPEPRIIYGRPVLVLRDPNFDGFEACGQILGEQHLKLISKALGNFHGRGLKLRKEDFQTFQEICEKFRKTEIPVDSEKCSIFIQKLINLSTENTLEKIKNKLTKNQDPDKLLTSVMETNEFSTICHGNVCRENLLFKYEPGKEGKNDQIPSEMKIIDFLFLKFASMTLDLVPLLFLTNFPIVIKKDQFEDFLQSYVRQIVTLCPEMSEQPLRREIVSKLFSTFVILSLDKNFTEDYLVEVLQLFEEIENSNF